MEKFKEPFIWGIFTSVNLFHPHLEEEINNYST